MNEIIRGTTPTNRFRLPAELRDKTFSEVRVIYRQWGHEPIVIQRDFQNFTPEDGIISVTLTQLETLQLRDKSSLKVQIKLKLPDGTVMSSRVKSIDIGETINDEVI